MEKKWYQAGGRNELFCMLANEKGDEIIEKLEKTDEVDFQDDKGDTYLHMACRSHYLKAIEVLLKKGANPNLCNNKGASPLMYAIGKIYKDNPDILKLFLEYGLDLEQVNYSDGMSIREIIYSFEDKDLINVIEQFEKEKNNS